MVTTKYDVATILLEVERVLEQETHVKVGSEYILGGTEQVCAGDELMQGIPLHIALERANGQLIAPYDLRETFDDTDYPPELNPVGEVVVKFDLSALFAPYWQAADYLCGALNKAMKANARLVPARMHLTAEDRLLTEASIREYEEMHPEGEVVGMADLHFHLSFPKLNWERQLTVELGTLFTDEELTRLEGCVREE